jgi:hypothetical protein
LRPRERIIIPLFHACIPLGKLYAHVLNFLADIKELLSHDI